MVAGRVLMSRRARRDSLRADGCCSDARAMATGACAPPSGWERTTVAGKIMISQAQIQ